jgi:hypothetical protein
MPKSKIKSVRTRIIEARVSQVVDKKALERKSPTRRASRPRLRVAKPTSAAPYELLAVASGDKLKRIRVAECDIAVPQISIALCADSLFDVELSPDKTSVLLCGWLLRQGFVFEVVGEMAFLEGVDILVPRGFFSKGGVQAA